MYSTESVSHGKNSCLNHMNGSCVSGVYPRGGTQLNRKESWRRLWVTRFTTSPSQKTGTEIPIRARIIRNGSKIVPRRTAAATPVRMLKTIQITAAPKTSESVTGVALTTSGITRV